MSDEHDNLDIPAEEPPDRSDPFVAAMMGADQHEADMQKQIRDRGLGFFLLWFLLMGSVYGNLYQLRQPKNIPYIHNVTEAGEVVPRILLRPEEVPPDDPRKLAFTKNFLRNWVTNARLRSLDISYTIKGINSALRTAAGPAQISLSADVKKEDVAARVKHETVDVEMSKLPVWLAGNTWRAEWVEITKNATGSETKRETWSGTFQLAEQVDWINGTDPYGIHVVGKSWAPDGK